MDKGSLNGLQIGGKSPQNCVSTEKEKGRDTYPPKGGVKGFDFVEIVSA